MLLTFDRCASLSSLLVLSVISSLVRSQAPGDASCPKGAVPDGVVRLLDSNWYDTLLPGQTGSAGWTQTPGVSWTESGNDCARRLQSCDPSATNWLVTQYIDKSVDVSYDLEITVEILANTGGSCTSCNSNTVNVHQYSSDGAIGSGQQLVTSNYNLIGPLSFSGAAGTKSVTFSLGSQFDRFYIAIVAEDVCFTLRRLQVSYELCVAKTESLVVYPNTPVGSAAVTTSASCIENGVLSVGSSLDVTCETDGTYSGSPSCSCAGGYIPSNDVCTVCGPGTFSKLGATTCLPCPVNSNSQEGAESCNCNANHYLDSRSCFPCPANSEYQPGSLTCTCIPGYFRTSTESGSLPCTRIPMCYVSGVKEQERAKRDTVNIVTQEYLSDYEAESRRSNEIAVQTEPSGADTCTTNATSTSTSGSISINKTLVLVFVTGFLSSAVTAVITSIVCLVTMRRRQQARANTSKLEPTPVYDNIAETTDNEMFPLKLNAGY